MNEFRSAISGWFFVPDLDLVASTMARQRIIDIDYEAYAPGTYRGRASLGRKRFRKPFGRKATGVKSPLRNIRIQSAPWSIDLSQLVAGAYRPVYSQKTAKPERFGAAGAL